MMHRRRVYSAEGSSRLFTQGALNYVRCSHDKPLPPSSTTTASNDPFTYLHQLYPSKVTASFDLSLQDANIRHTYYDDLPSTAPIPITNNSNKQNPNYSLDSILPHRQHSYHTRAKSFHQHPNHNTSSSQIQITEQLTLLNDPLPRQIKKITIKKRNFSAFPKDFFSSSDDTPSFSSISLNSIVSTAVPQHPTASFNNNSNNNNNNPHSQQNALDTSLQLQAQKKRIKTTTTTKAAASCVPSLRLPITQSIIEQQLPNTNQIDDTFISSECVPQLDTNRSQHELNSSTSSHQQLIGLNSTSSLKPPLPSAHSSLKQQGILIRSTPLIIKSPPVPPPTQQVTSKQQNSSTDNNSSNRNTLMQTACFYENPFTTALPKQQPKFPSIFRQQQVLRLRNIANPINRTRPNSHNNQQIIESNGIIESLKDQLTSSNAPAISLNQLDSLFETKSRIPTRRTHSLASQISKAPILQITAPKTTPKANSTSNNLHQFSLDDISVETSRFPANSQHIQLYEHNTSQDDLLEFSFSHLNVVAENNQPSTKETKKQDKSVKLMAAQSEINKPHPAKKQPNPSHALIKVKAIKKSQPTNSQSNINNKENLLEYPHTSSKHLLDSKEPFLIKVNSSNSSFFPLNVPWKRKTGGFNSISNSNNINGITAANSSKTLLGSQNQRQGHTFYK